MTRGLAVAAVAFGLLALGAGVAQFAAYSGTGWARYLVLGVFASAVGVSVLTATVVTLRRHRMATKLDRIRNGQLPTKRPINE